MVPQIPTHQQIHNQVQFLPILKSIGHINQEGMLQLRQQFPLIQHRMYTLLGNNLGLIHFLHRVQLASSLHDDTPHFAEPSLPDHVIELEMATADLDCLGFGARFVLDYYFVLFFMLVGKFG